MIKSLKYFLFLWLSVAFTSLIFAQTISTTDKRILKSKEDSLKFLAKNLITDSLTESRMRSDSLFVKTMIRSLQTKNSFFYPFDSVQGISKIYAPDSSFKIFTWYLQYDDYYGRQRGFIQMRTKDGTLKGFALRDNSEFTEFPNSISCSDSNWIGAVYYNIIKTQFQNKNYYTLFGNDYHSVRSSKKWIEVLTFDEKNRPLFGGDFFSFEEDSTIKETQHRFGFEYKKEASTFANFVPELNVILFDHLISETAEQENAWTFVPDGDYEGFQWRKGKWVHIEKVFKDKLQDGQAPVSVPYFDTKKTTKKSEGIK